MPPALFQHVTGVLALALTGWACAGTPAIAPRPTPSADASLAPTHGGKALSPRIANYAIDVRFDPNNHTVEGQTTLTWRNTGKRAFHEVPLHLYLNAFKNQASWFLKTSNSAREKLTDFGYIDILEAYQGEKAVTLKPSPTPPAEAPLDETVTWVALAAPVAPNAELTLTLRFKARLPNVVARTGYAGAFHLVGQWFPKIGVVTADGLGFECKHYHRHAEYYADFGTYDVTITAPQSYELAATGVRTHVVNKPDGQRLHTFRAHDVHDFVWMADPWMERVAREVQLPTGTTTVQVYHRPRQRAFAERHLEAAVGTLTLLSRWLGPYPYAVLTIIDTPLEAKGAGGMEYPTLVTTNGDHALMTRGVRFPEFVTVHEVTHQWFQGMLASNEAAEAWLDEGLNQWLNAHTMEALYGGERDFLNAWGWYGSTRELGRVVGEPPAASALPIASPPEAFENMAAYGHATYNQAAAALDTWERAVGSERFFAALGRYTRNQAFRHPTASDFLASMQADLGDWQPLTTALFYQRGYSRLRFTELHCAPLTPDLGYFGPPQTRREQASATSTGAFGCELTLANTGTVNLPTSAVVTFADGTTEHLAWQGNAPWQRYRFERTSPIISIEIDPDRRLQVDDSYAHQRRMMAANPAVDYAANGVAFWAQTMMQAVGL